MSDSSFASLFTATEPSPSSPCSLFSPCFFFVSPLAREAEEKAMREKDGECQ